MITSSVPVEVHCTLQRLSGQSAQPKALVEEFLLDRELQFGRKVLPRDKRFDDARDKSLLMDIDEGFKLDRGRQRHQIREDLGMSRRLIGVRLTINDDGFMRRSRVDEFRKTAVAIQLREVDTCGDTNISR